MAAATVSQYDQPNGRVVSSPTLKLAPNTATDITISVPTPINQCIVNHMIRNPMK